jgi:hypothetical protein
MAKVSFEQVKDLLGNCQSYEKYAAAICPFHEDQKPSLLVFKDGWFKCQACGQTGDFDKLYRKLLGWDASKSFKEVTSFHGPRLPRSLAELEVVVGESHDSLLQFDQFQWYLRRRGVENRIESCRLGWLNGWYVIPIYDKYRQLQGAMLRANAAIQASTGQRFSHPQGQKNMMYCPDWRLLETRKSVAVVFGMFDALALSDLRFAVVTATNGDLGFDPSWLDSVRKPIYVIPDKGGEHAAINLASKLGWRGKVKYLDYPDDIKDPDGYLETERRELLQTSLLGELGE